MKYFEQFLENRGLTYEMLEELFSYDDTLYIKGTDEMCNILHDLPRDIPIALMSDYDVDGIYAGLTGFEGLHLIGFTNVKIANRHVDKGYQFTREDIDELGDVKLIITSDVGISCTDAINYAISKGIKVIVTDHHVPTLRERPNTLVIDWLLDDTFTDKNIEVCGAYTVWQVYNRYFELYGSEYENLSDIQSDLVCLRHFAAMATVSDSMPLIGRNHYIVSDMLKFCNYINPYNRRDDIAANICTDPVLQNIYNNFHKFVKACSDDYYVEFDKKFLEFSIIPVINSIKRMCDDPSIAYMMLFGNEEESNQYVDYLVQLNNTRKLLVNDLFNNIYVEHIAQPFADIIYMTSAPSGVLGLLAQKIITETQLPAVVLSKELRFDDGLGEWVYDGSIRSPKWYPFLSRVNSSGFGKCSGHEVACAITVPSSKIMNLYGFLVEDLKNYVDIANRPVTKAQKLEHFDIVLDYAENFFNFQEDVAQLMTDMKEWGPYGSGFPEPRIMLKFHKEHAIISSLKEGQHTKIALAPTDISILLWNTTPEEVEKSSDEEFIYLEGYLATSIFRGKTNINFIATPILDGTEIA